MTPVRTARFHQVSAFARTAFSGNPAGVVLLERWPGDRELQCLAAEIGLAATAFIVAGPGGHELRWFTPTVEEQLCGHATLAAAWVLFHGEAPNRRTESRISFRTRAGLLTVERGPNDLLTIDMPGSPVAPVPDDEALTNALGCAPVKLFAARYYLALLKDADSVINLQPDIAAIGRLDRPWVVVTAEGHGEFDCVSRYFAPGNGISEDSATGSAHCMIVPFWAQRLGKTKLRAFQASRRGGFLECEIVGDRTRLGGYCIPFMEGIITI